MVRFRENNREVFSSSRTLPTTREFTIVEMRYKITEIVSLSLILIFRYVLSLYVKYVPQLVPVKEIVITFQKRTRIRTFGLLSWSLTIGRYIDTLLTRFAFDKVKI